MSDNNEFPEEDKAAFYAPMGYILVGLAASSPHNVPMNVMTFTYDDKPIVVQATFWEEPWEPVELDLEVFTVLGQTVAELIEQLEQDPETPAKVDSYIVKGSSILRWTLEVKVNKEGLTIDNADEVAAAIPVKSNRTVH